MTIDLLQQEDLEQVTVMTPQGWDDLRPHFQYHLDTAFCLPLKAVVDGQLAGLGNVIHNGDTAWLAQIVVAAGFRNRGIGKAITGALLAHIDRQCYPTILLDATDMGYPVYHSFGFETISRHVHFAGALLPGSSDPDPALIAYEEVYADPVKKLDRDATGEDRTGSLQAHWPMRCCTVKRDRSQEFIFLPGSAAPSSQRRRMRAQHWPAYDYRKKHMP